MTKNYFFIIKILLLVLSAINTVAAQESISESKIKTSEKYFWEKVTDSDTIRGKINAAELLWASDKIKNAISSGNKLEKQNISYFIGPRGNSFQIVAYIPKNVENVSIAKINNSSSKKFTTKIVGEISKGQQIPEADKTATNSNLTSIERKSEKENSSTQKSTLNKVDNTSYKSSSLTLNKLSTCTDCDCVFNLLNKYKKEGKVSYSTRADAFSVGLSNCYILICDLEANKLLYLLDKGDGNRLDVLTSKYIITNDLFQNTNFKSIYIYEY